MKTIITLSLLMLSAQVFAAQAFFTGMQTMVTTVTYQQAWNCQYNYNGQLFWRTFTGSCPSSIQVQ